VGEAEIPSAKNENVWLFINEPLQGSRQLALQANYTGIFRNTARATLINLDDVHRMNQCFLSLSRRLRQLISITL
jgi:anti-anti-sigma regulatory factor